MRTPPLLAQYAAVAGSATSPEVELISTIDPLPAATIDGRTARAHRKLPVRFTAIVRCQSATEVSVAVPDTRTPALVNRMSIPPCAARTALTSASTDAS